MRQRGNDLTLGTTADGQTVPLTREQRGKHLYVVGATGTGKSKFLEHLIRQDILNWHRSHCGLIVFDKHGAMFDSLMAWIAAKELRYVPIVPIDLRRDDWIVSYNVLRRRPAGDPAVIVGSLARAIAHAWGQGNMDETPRLAKWLPTILGTLYEQGHTLADSLHLLANPELRRAMTADVKGFAARNVWAMSEGLRPAEFHEEVASTFNRLLRFLNNQTMRATLCQTDASFDLGQALECGNIVLVSLATAGTQIDVEDARTFGSMLLSDLWTAAQARGKRDEGAGGVKPFYAYIDEFQEYVTPVMAETLDQARGFGIHLALAQQFPSQLSGRGELGRMVFDSVMANTRTKVVFQLDHPEDLPTLALWLGRNAIDLDEVKHQHYSTKVLGYQLSYLPSYNSSATVGRMKSTSHSAGISEGVGSALTHGRSTSRGVTHSHGTGSSSGESWHNPDPSDPFSSFNAEEAPRTYSEGRSDSDNESLAEGEAESWGETESWSRTESRSISESAGESRAEMQGTSQSPMLMPIMGQEALPPQFRSLEEQVFRLTQMLSGQPDRHAVVRLAGEVRPWAIAIPCVLAPRTVPWYVKRRTIALLGRLPFALPMPEALKRLVHHETTFAQIVMSSQPALEPVSFKRRIASRSLPTPAARQANPKPAEPDEQPAS